MKRPATSFSALAPWLLGLLALIILGTLYRLSSQADDEGRHRVELYANELAALDLTVNLNLMKLQNRQKLDYDELVFASQRIDLILDRLDGEFARLRLDSSLTPVKHAWQEKQEDLEDFKRVNAIFSTSQFHFINLAEELSQSRDSPRLNQLARRLHAFLMQGGEELPILLSSVYQLEGELNNWDPAMRPRGKLLVTHAALILEHYRQIKQLSRDLLASPFTSTLSLARADYEGAYRNAATSAARYRVALAVFALLLVAVAVLSLFRLNQSTRALQRSHRQLDSIADNLGEGVVAFNGRQQLYFINRRARELLGNPDLDGKGIDVQDVLFRNTSGLNNEKLLRAVRERQAYSGENWLSNGNTLLPATLIGAPLPEEGGEGTYVLSFRDLTENKRTEARLQLASHVFDSLAEAMVITDHHGRIQFVNPAFSNITGFSESEALGRRPGDLVGSGLHDAAFFSTMWQSLLTHGQWHGEIINRRKDGRRYTEWLSISAVRDAIGHPVQYVGLFSDITERKEAEAHIHHLAYHDPLTGLANRLLFRDRLDTALRQSNRNDRSLAVLILDLDRFKLINDSLGHEAGDTLLIEVARRMAMTVRECDTLARLGGDEFALLMPEIRSPDDAISVARKLIQSLLPEFILNDQEVFATTSIGISVYPDHGESGELLLRNADVALYAAKNSGRNTWKMFAPENDEQGTNRLELESALRHALERGELLLHYQPQFASHDGSLTGVEALARWQHPRLGMVPPDRFIPVAEQTGMIEEIGAWCLRTACRQFVDWRAAGIEVPRLAVNVSARQLRAAGFTEQVINIVEETGIPPNCLELELTESMLSENTEQTFAIFKELRSHGLRIAIDDFGTGYSSLNYIAQFPVDVLKIDRSFVRNMDTGNEGDFIVRAIILLAQGMRMETVAEGVETELQQNRLFDLGCNHLQGFLLARPQIPEQLAQFVNKPEAEPPAH
jgi:diguanylate cyclase (GGDEF)-like protein/PAS domain S-box-containing protein